MTNFKHNNLASSDSPYLRQHAGNPVWWQEWGSEVLEYAKREDKPLLVSSGYSTCHWCHVMASGAFSDKETAAFLNDHFVCIKIDREQRPDIDQFLMQFIQAQNGSGGWPLNVFLTPQISPFFALTYAPAAPGGRSLSFLEIATQIRDYYEKYGNRMQPFEASEHVPSETQEGELINNLATFYDDEHGGFGRGQKFPPHCTLLFLLYRLSAEEDHLTRSMCIQTLDAMCRRGLHDHLQGGIFRYCTDREWTIPHFEKMLYDQAMALWVYSLAYKVLEKATYLQMADKILTCLSESFEEDGLYITAWDADTDHEEGATYLWSYKELAEILSPDEFRQLNEVYYISEEGNFEGKNHLIRKNDKLPEEIERKLLTIRKDREQPFRDGKLISGLNALVAVSLIHAGRLLNRPELEAQGTVVVDKITDLFWDGFSLGHSLYDGELQSQSFLSDAAALLLAVTLLAETDPSRYSLLETLVHTLESFRENGTWIESKAEDFRPVAASWFDHPSPSGVSLAEVALTRAALLRGQEFQPADYRRPYFADFYNLGIMIRNGEFNDYTSEQVIPWKLLPANALQKRGTPETHCYRGVCRILDLK